MAEIDPDDTVPFPPFTDEELPVSLPVNREDNMAETAPPSRVPEPALIRGAVVSVLALVGVVLGKTFDVAVVDDYLEVYAVVVPLVTAWLIRRKVSPA